MDKLSTRKQEILQVLLTMLEQSPATITTKSLAQSLSITESALYRHFSSKRHMYLTLVQLLDQKLLTRARAIMQDGSNYLDILHDILLFYVSFADKNRGFARLLLVMHLDYEDKQLVTDVLAVLEKFEGLFRQIMRDMEVATSVRVTMKHIEASSFIMSYLQGMLLRSLYAKYRVSNAAQFSSHWQRLTEMLFVTK